MPLNEEHDRFERAVEMEIEHWWQRLDGLNAAFPGSRPAPQETANIRHERRGRIGAPL